jgi:hypothetical protein
MHSCLSSCTAYSFYIQLLHTSFVGGVQLMFRTAAPTLSSATVDYGMPLRMSQSADIK